MVDLTQSAATVLKHAIAYLLDSYMGFPSTREQIERAQPIDDAISIMCAALDTLGAL